jgi:hypothetical protein
MVVISLKLSDGDGFLFETTTSTPNNDLIKSLVDIHNGRLQSSVVIDSVRGLASYGPMKQPSETGIDEVAEKYADKKVDKGPNYKPDPTGIRTGNAPDENLVETLLRVIKDLEDYIDKSQVQRRVPLTYSELQNKLANVRGAVMMAYPMGLPAWETTALALNSIDGLKGTHVEKNLLDPNSTSLWVAGKEFPKGKLVSDRLGKNEKTKVIAKLQNTGSGPPAREPIVNEEERKAMMAHYFKKQEELKKLSEANDDDYLNSAWADPKEMKKGLQGLQNIKAPGFKF